MPFPRAIRYTRMPSHGTRITNSTQKVLAPPPMSLLRKMSPKIQKRHMNQAKNRKNSNSARTNDPLSLNINQPFGEANTVARSGPPLSFVPFRKLWHAPIRVRDRAGATDYRSGSAAIPGAPRPKAPDYSRPHPP